MLKKELIVTFLLSAALITGCGGGSEGDDVTINIESPGDGGTPPDPGPDPDPGPGDGGL